jgi:hypothetical protein
MRCFVIGNGLSLRTHDLALMSNDVTFACNKIHLRYPFTSWRPTHWCSFDRTDYQTTIAEYLSHFKQDYQCHIASDWFGFRTGRVDPTMYPNVTLWTVCNAPHSEAQSWNHIAKTAHQFCRYNGTGINAIELAIRYLGFEEVYILGFDLGYTDDETKNHFDPSYLPGYSRSIDNARRINKQFAEAHIIAKREAEARDAVIYNAGRVGNLPYPKVIYEELF